VDSAKKMLEIKEKELQELELKLSAKESVSTGTWQLYNIKLF